MWKVSVAMVLSMLLQGSVSGQISLIGSGSLPGTTSDLSGLKGSQTDGTPHNRLGGLGSGVAYTGQGNSYVLIADRGPKDGATDFACRYHRMDIVVKPGSTTPVELKLTGTTLLKDETGRQQVGTLAAIDQEKPERSLRLDAEGIRVGPRNTLFISDEYGPFVGEYSPEGKRLRLLPLPSRYLPERIGMKPEEELPPRNRFGRQPNRGMEGLAISPDGSKLFGIMQSPLIQDGGLDAENKRVGLNCRILELPVAGGETRELVYTLESASNGVSEIVAVNDHQFLVLERDGKGGMETQCKKLFLIDVSPASDVSSIASLPTKGLPDGIKPVSKKLFLDMLDPQFGLKGVDFPEKIEGLAFGPDLPDGRRLLIVTADNDFVATAPFRVYAFAIEASMLPGYVSQRFEGGKR